MAQPEEPMPVPSNAALALSGAMEHSLSVLEAQRVWTPRRGRKMMGATSERVEELLDSMDAGSDMMMMSQLAACEEPALRMLCERLRAVEGLRAGEGLDVASAIACVEAMLEELLFPEAEISSTLFPFSDLRPPDDLLTSRNDEFV